MKKFTVALALCATSGVFAQDLMLGDLNFFQQAGSVRWNTELDYSKVDSEENKDEYTRAGINFNNAVTYGISDKLNVGLGLNYTLKNEVTNDKVAAGPKDKKTTSDGLSDVTVLGNYRLMDQQYYVDLVGGLTLGLTDAEVAFGTPAGESEGNNNQGHHSIALGAAAGQKINTNWEWRAFLGLDYHMSGEITEVQKGQKSQDVDTASFIDWKLSVDGQYRMDNKWAFAAGLDYILPGEQTLEFTAANGGDEDIDEDAHFRIRLAAKHNLSDSMLVSLGYDMTSSHDVESKSTGGKNTVELDAAHRFVLGAQFLF